MLGQLADTVVGLLRQYHAGLCTLQLGLAGSDHLCARANFDIGELRLGDDPGGERLLVLGKRFRIIDFDQHRAGRNVLAALNGNLGDATIDPCSDVEPCCIHLALHQQRLASQQIPDRQAGDGHDHERDDDRRHTSGRWCPRLGPLAWALAPTARGYPAFWPPPLGLRRQISAVR